MGAVNMKQVVFIFLLLLTFVVSPMSGWCEEHGIPEQELKDPIEPILTPQGESPYLLKVGVSGFLRGEGSSDFTYSLAGSGYTPGSGVGRLTYRIIPYLEWNPTDYLEVEVQGQGYGFTLGSPRDSQYALYQGYLEISSPETKRVKLKLGRQEFVYGSAFILGGNSFYNGLTYDGARLRMKPVGEMTVDLLGGYFAAPQSHYVKDSLKGVYLNYPLSEGTGVEAYYIRDQGPQFSLSGERLETLGMRGTVRLGPVALEFEPVYQTGKRADNSGALGSIDAWGGHADLALETEIGDLKNTFVLGYAYGAGSQDAADGRSTRREFSNPTNNTALIGDMGLFHDLSGITTSDGVFHASGLQIITVGWGINVFKNLNFTATGRYYRANNTPYGINRHLGVESDFITTWNITEDSALIIAYDHFFTCGFFRDTSGSTHDINYGYVMLQFNLSTGIKKPAPLAGNSP
jgi:Alginate export